MSKPICFILMPFRSAHSLMKRYDPLDVNNLDTIYSILRQCLGKVGYEVRRSSGKGDILAEIVLNLDQADLVVADLTGLNPNVMYELGIRHGFTKKTILLTQDLAELPFDLRNYHCVEYKWKNKVDQLKLGRDIRATLADIAKSPDVRFGPVHSHLGSKLYALREEELRLVAKRLYALACELVVFNTLLSEAWEKTKVDHPNAFKECPSPQGPPLGSVTMDDKLAAKPNEYFQQAWMKLPSSTPAIDLALSWRYIPEELDSNGQLALYYDELHAFRFYRHTVDTFTNRAFVLIFSRITSLIMDTDKILCAVRKGDLTADLKLSFGDVE